MDLRVLLLDRRDELNLRQLAWIGQAFGECRLTASRSRPEVKKPPSETDPSRPGGEWRQLEPNSCFMHSSIFASIFPFILHKNPWREHGSQPTITVA